LRSGKRRKWPEQMAEKFRGEFYQKVDAKARVSIPAAFRRVLEAGDPAKGQNPRVVLVYGGDRRFVEGYSLEGMARLEARIGRMQLGSEGRLYLEHNMITLSQTVDIDGDGRIVMSQKVREKIELADLSDGADAVFAGTLDTFRLWRRDTYEATKPPTVVEALIPKGQDMTYLLPPDTEG
jgi:MraZ protein